MCPGGPTLASSRNPVRADDKSFGSGADKIERVTGYQGEDVVNGIVQHRSVLGLDHLGRVHAIAVGSVQRRQANFIVLVNIA